MRRDAFRWRSFCFAAPCGRNVSLSRVGAADDVPIARRRVSRGKAEHCFERSVTVKAAVVSEHELVEICIGVLAAQSVIRAQSPSLHQGEDPMNPGQHDVRGHLANHARIVPVASQSWIRGMAVRQQRRAGFYVGSHESLDRGRRVVGDHREADAARTGVEIFRVFASRFGLMGVAFNHLDSADDGILPALPGSKNLSPSRERNFGLIDFDDAFEKFAIRIDHRTPQFLRQQPSCSVGEAELILQLPRRHAVGMRRHQMRGPEPYRQRKPRAMHRRARRDRRLTTAAIALEGVCAADQRGGAVATAGRTHKTIRPATFEQECRAARLVGKFLLEFRE